MYTSLSLLVISLMRRLQRQGCECNAVNRKSSVWRCKLLVRALRFVSCTQYTCKYPIHFISFQTNYLAYLSSCKDFFQLFYNNIFCRIFFFLFPSCNLDSALFQSTITCKCMASTGDTKKSMCVFFYCRSGEGRWCAYVGDLVGGVVFSQCAVEQYSGPH